MNTEVLIWNCHKCYDFPPRPARPIKKESRAKRNKETYYELGRFHGAECVFLVYPEYMYRKVPYRIDKKRHKNWEYIEKFGVYRCNTSMI